MAKQKREYFKFDFRNVVKFECTCGRRYINTSNCLQTTDSRSPQTNADRIRSMTDEELAKYLVNFKNTFGEEYEGEISCLEWLRSEVEEEQ